MAIKIVAKKPDNEATLARQAAMAERQRQLTARLQAEEDEAARKLVESAKAAAAAGLAAAEQEAQAQRDKLAADLAEKQKELDALKARSDADAAAAREAAEAAKKKIEEEAAAQSAATAEKLAAAQQAVAALDAEDAKRAQDLAAQEQAAQALVDAAKAEEDAIAARIAAAAAALAEADKAGASAADIMKYENFVSLAAALNVSFATNDDGGRAIDNYLDSRLASLPLVFDVRSDAPDGADSRVFEVQVDNRYYEVTDTTVGMLADEKISARDAFAALSLARAGANFAAYPVQIFDDAADKDTAAYNKYMLYLIAKEVKGFAIENEDELKSLARYAATKDIAAQAKQDFDAFIAGNFYKGLERTVDPARLQADLEAETQRLSGAFNASAGGKPPGGPDDPGHDDPGNDDDGDAPAVPGNGDAPKPPSAG